MTKHSNFNGSLALLAALAVLVFWGTAVAAESDAVSCNQEGSTLSGQCSDGSNFSLTCTDGENTIDCDHSEDLAWSICDDQCTRIGDGLRPVHKGPAERNSGLSPRRVKATKRMVHRKKQVNKHLQTRRVSDANAIEVARTRGAALTISVTVNRAGHEQVVWNYQEGDDELRYSCIVGQDCQIFENGRVVRAGHVSFNAIQLSQGAHELMAGLNWEDDIPSDWIDALCTVATGAAFIWPIGTAIAGPTAIGCLIMEIQEEG